MLLQKGELQSWPYKKLESMELYPEKYKSAEITERPIKIPKNQFIPLFVKGWERFPPVANPQRSKTTKIIIIATVRKRIMFPTNCLG